MKNVLITIIILSCISMISQAQYVDRVPLVKACETKDLKEFVRCSDDTIKDYFRSRLDTAVCGDLDTIKGLSITWNVDKRGRMTSVQVNIWNAEGGVLKCQEVLQSIGSKLRKEIEMTPAMLNGKRVEFRKDIRFVETNVEMDTMIIIAFDSTIVDARYSDEEPRFNVCESMIGNKWEIDNCAQLSMLTFVYKNLKYPLEARKNGIQGMVVLQFIIEKDGTITSETIAREIGKGCGQAALDVLTKMNESMDQPFIPGIIDGSPVRTKYTLPVRFKLEGK